MGLNWEKSPHEAWQKEEHRPGTAKSSPKPTDSYPQEQEDTRKPSTTMVMPTEKQATPMSPTSWGGHSDVFQGP